MWGTDHRLDKLDHVLVWMLQEQVHGKAQFEQNVSFCTNHLLLHRISAGTVRSRCWTTSVASGLTLLHRSELQTLEDRDNIAQPSVLLLQLASQEQRRCSKEAHIKFSKGPPEVKALEDGSSTHADNLREPQKPRGSLYQLHSEDTQLRLHRCANAILPRRCAAKYFCWDQNVRVHTRRRGHCSGPSPDMLMAFNPTPTSCTDNTT
mmetsp:Transcript_128134/g.232958  ORF Transcript_128134/g.232958 Transcript_128134/m.232958 type:complete len:206 (+) Transcript_128134:555-1172(+)